MTRLKTMMITLERMIDRILKKSRGRGEIERSVYEDRECRCVTSV